MPVGVEGAWSLIVLSSTEGLTDSNEPSQNCHILVPQQEYRKLGFCNVCQSCVNAHGHRQGITLPNPTPESKVLRGHLLRLGFCVNEKITFDHPGWLIVCQCVEHIISNHHAEVKELKPPQAPELVVHTFLARVYLESDPLEAARRFPFPLTRDGPTLLYIKVPESSPLPYKRGMQIYQVADPMTKITISPAPTLDTLVCLQNVTSTQVDMVMRNIQAFAPPAGKRLHPTPRTSTPFTGYPTISGNTLFCTAAPSLPQTTKGCSWSFTQPLPKAFLIRWEAVWSQ